MQWGDDEDELYCPPTSTVGPDAKGIKTVTIVKLDEDDKRIQVVKRIRVVKRVRRVSKAIGRRTKWSRFGQFADGKDEGITFLSTDEVRLEHPDDQGKREKEEGEQLIQHLRDGAQKRAERKAMAAAGIAGFDAEGNKVEGTLTGGGLRRGTALSEALARGEDGKDGSLGNKYVPPSMRAGAAQGGTQFREREEETNTLRVTNISEDTSERDLQELFRPFGSVARIYLAKDRETQMSRGFAYVSYHNRQDAERAMEKLHGFGYDHLILSIEWAKPSVRDDNAGAQNSMKHASGYGKALPQGLG